MSAPRANRSRPSVVTGNDARALWRERNCQPAVGEPSKWDEREAAVFVAAVKRAFPSTVEIERTEGGP